MRDLKLYYTEEQGFDINIVDGYPEDVDYENQTQDQRAAIGAVFEKGTLPGDLDVGVDWGRLYSKEDSMIDISNEVSAMVQRVAGGNGQADGTYLPIFVPDENGAVKVTVMKGSI